MTLCLSLSSEAFLYLLVTLVWNHNLSSLLSTNTPRRASPLSPIRNAVISIHRQSLGLLYKHCCNYFNNWVLVFFFSTLGLSQRAALQTMSSLLHLVCHPLLPLNLQYYQAQSVRNGAFRQYIYNVTQVLVILSSKVLKIASVVQKL